MKKRILSLVLALVMVLGLLPMGTLAAGSYDETDQIVTVEKYDAEGNGTFLLLPKRAAKTTSGYGSTWIANMIGSDSVQHDGSYITAIKDADQEDEWLSNGDIADTSKWLVAADSKCYLDASNFYASRVKVVRVIFTPSGDGSELKLVSSSYGTIGAIPVSKDALIDLVSRYEASDFAEGSAQAKAYQAALDTILDVNATAETVAAAKTAFEDALSSSATAITLSPDSLTVSLGKTETVTATLTPATATDTITWSTGDERIATVDQNGVVTGVSQGTTTLTAKVSDAVSATISVTVSPVDAATVTLADEEITMNVRDIRTLTATVEPENASGSFAWSVADESIAEITADGTITALKAGTTTVTVRFGDATDTATLNVTNNPYVYFEYTNGKNQYMAADGSFTLSSLDEGTFKVANTDATPWWENEEIIGVPGTDSVTYHWYVDRETGLWQPSGQQPTAPIVVTAGDFTKSFTIHYQETSGITALKTYIGDKEVTTDSPYEVTGCVSGVAVTTKGLKDGTWVDIPVQALNYDTSDNVYYNFRFIGNEMTINRAGNATMTVSLKGENVSTSFRAVCNPVEATAMKVVVPETVEISDWDVNGYYVGVRPFTGYQIEFEPANATNRDVTWEALTPEVANHSDLHSAGIYPIKAGTAQFLVTNTTNPSLTQTVTVTFHYKNPLTAASTESSYTMEANTAQLFTISVTPENATEQRFTWTYSQDGIVEVSDKIETSEDGLSHWTTHQIKALKAGTVTVTGTPWDETGGCQPVTFTVTVSGGAQEPPAAVDRTRISTLMETLAASYVDSSDSWVILDMAAYETLLPDTTWKTSQAAKQAYINSAIASVQSDSADSNTYSKAILSLTAIGADPTQLYPLNSSTPVNCAEALKNLTITNLYYAPWVLLANLQGSLNLTDAQISDLIQLLDENQMDSGMFGYEWGGQSYTDPDTTGTVIAALAPLYATNSAAKGIIDDAIAGLSSTQDSVTGSYGNANSDAMIIIGLAAMGIDPSSDSRFVKNGTSLLEGLLSYALADNSGFGYMDSTSSNGLATEQGFRALIAASQVMNTGSACNIYDFSGNTLTPAYETGSTTPTDPEEPSTPADPENTITVTVSIQADTGYWLRAKSVTVSQGSTVCDAFVQALEGTGITQVGAQAGYIRSITKNGVTLAEFTKGPNSGWLYTVNGALPTVSVTSYTLSDGDAILLYYTDDWTKDPNAGTDPADQAAADQVSALIAAIGTVTDASGDQIAAARAAYDRLSDTQKALVSNYSSLTTAEKAYAALTAPASLPFTDVDGHWALDAIQKVYDQGLMTGTKATQFSPDTALNRAMLVTILYRLEGSPAVTQENPFTDTAADAWYTDAVIWASQLGIVDGYGNGAFGPLNNITREQMAAILLRYAQYKTYDTSASADLSVYTDAGDISAWALDALQWANGAGLISGRAADLLVPAGSTTRAETAVILVRFLEQIAA